MMALIRMSVRLLTVAALLYGTFLMRVGSYTLYEHGTRISTTPEAAELRLNVGDAFDDATGLLTDHLGNPEAPGFD